MRSGKNISDSLVDATDIVKCIPERGALLPTVRGSAGPQAPLSREEERGVGVGTTPKEKQVSRLPPPLADSRRQRAPSLRRYRSRPLRGTRSGWLRVLSKPLGRPMRSPSAEDRSADHTEVLGRDRGQGFISVA